jgi:hypothetical protein
MGEYQTLSLGLITEWSILLPPSLTGYGNPSILRKVSDAGGPERPQIFTAAV